MAAGFNIVRRALGETGAQHNHLKMGVERGRESGRDEGGEGYEQRRTPYEVQMDG